MSGRMLRSMLSVVLLVALVAGLAFAQTTGRFRGRVLDRDTKEPLVGANVTVEGTSMGAACDVNGEYIILNVPPGAFSLKASYVGYKTTILRNKIVTTGQTTEANFDLESEAIPGPAIEIIAQPPLIDKSATNTISLVRSEQIQNLPVRNVQNIFTLAPGVVQQGGAYYVRGGRSEETAYYIDGVLVNNPMNGALQLNVINNAIEEVQTQIGGMTAQYGNGMSAVVSTTTKTGGPKYNVTLEAITDGLVGGKESKSFMGAYSYGLNEYVLTIGGPVVPGSEKIRFFLAGQRVFNRTNPTYLDGVSFPTIDSTAISGVDWVVVDEQSVDRSIETRPTGSTGNRTYLANLLNSTDYSGGRTYGGYDNDQWGLQGNVLFDLGSFNIKVGGSYSQSSSIGSYGRTLNISAVTAGMPRGTLTENNDWSAYGKFTHIIDPTTFYSIQLSSYTFFSETGDQYLMDDIANYGNPNHSANGVLVGPSRNPPDYNVWSFGASWPGIVPDNYNKLLRSNFGGRFDFTKQFGKIWELVAGAEYTRYTLRSYGISAIDLYKSRIQAPNASDWEIYAPQAGQIYGYDIYGNEFDGGAFTDKTGKALTLNDEGPKHPVFAGGYVQNRFEFSDLIINFGLRYDYIDPGWREYRDLQNIALDSYEGVAIVADSSYKDQEVSTQLSPRLGFSFPVTDQTVFHATYGRFMQQGRLNDLYDSRLVAAYFFAGGYARRYPMPNLKPERTTDYEVGFRQQIGAAASFDLTFFYKDIKDLHVIRTIFPEPGSQIQSYFATVNGDYGTSKGITFTFQMRRTERVAVNANYTLSGSTATGSASQSHFNIAWQDNSFNGTPYYPVIPTYTDFDRTHNGIINLDYRFAENDGGPILERLGLNLLFRFQSGIRWTKSSVTGAFGFSAQNAPFALEQRNASEGPWAYTLDLKLDKSIMLPGNLDLNLYLWVTNVFDRRNIVNVYSGTGEQSNDGWFTTESGRTWAQNNGPNAVAMYDYFQNNLGFLDPPRVVRFGARLSL